MIHLEDSYGILEQIRDTARLITSSEKDFLAMYEEMLWMFLKREGIRMEVKQSVLDLLKSINGEQLRIIKSSAKNLKVYGV